MTVIINTSAASILKDNLKSIYGPLVIENVPISALCIIYSKIYIINSILYIMDHVLCIRNCIVSIIY